MLEIIAAAGVSLPAVFLWIIEKPLFVRFIGRIRILTSVGQLTALIGLALFVVVLFFSTRPKFLEKRFGGLDKIYKYHHLLGIISFILLLIHPTTLAIAKLHPSVSGFFHYFYISGFWPQDLGIISIYLMIVLLTLTLFFRPAYHIWKISHKFLGIAFLLGILHSFFIGSDISYFLPLKIYMMFLVVIGLLSGIYQILLSGFLRKKHKYEVGEINNISENIYEIILYPKIDKLKYEPGQFIYVKFIEKGVSGEYHPFSLASSPQDNNLRLIIKKSGDYTDVLNLLKRGADSIVEGPYGRFIPPTSAEKEQVWIAGGIGIAPFLGMLKDAKEMKIDFYYCANSEEDAPFLSEVGDVSKENKHFRVTPYFSNGKNHISTEVIKNISGDLTNKEYYICGPEGLIMDLTKELIGEGVKKQNIHSELFNY